MAKCILDLSDSYELFYNTGGHGGPHHGLEEAIDHAKDLLAGCPTLSSVEVRPYGTKLSWDKVKPVAIVHRQTGIWRLAA